MTITYFVPGTEPEVQVLSGLSGVILDLAGKDPGQWEGGSISANEANEAADGLELVADGQIGRIVPVGLYHPGDFYRDKGGSWQHLGFFKDRLALVSYFEAKAHKLRLVAAEAEAAGTTVSYG